MIMLALNEPGMICGAAWLSLESRFSIGHNGGHNDG
jgi:hypothetical protein